MSPSQKKKASNEIISKKLYVVLKLLKNQKNKSRKI